jgi:hypothetical protein
MKLKYVELPPERIFNWLDPFNNTARGICNQRPDLLENWWDDKTIELRKLIAKTWTEEFDNITGHFTKLRKSIVEKGILTPISTVSGEPRDQYLKPRVGKPNDHFPPEYENNLHDIIYTHPFGGSRLTIAVDLGLDSIPCIVHDFSNLFPDAEVIHTKNYHKWFNDKEYFFTGAPPHVRLRQHSHLTGKYNGMNGHTRDAQRKAMEITKEKLGL